MHQDPTCVSNLSDNEKDKPYSYYEQVVPVKVHHFYINDVIGGPELYTDMVHRLRTAASHDHVYVYLNTPGGRLDTTIQLVNAMRSSQAHITTVVEAKSHSGGTMLFLSGDEYVVNDNCSMLFHNFSGGAFGKGNELFAQVNATDSWFRKLVHDVYKYFMTPEEIDSMLEGKDFWFDSDEIKERLVHMVSVYEQEQNGEVEPEPIGKTKTPRKTPGRKAGQGKAKAKKT